MVRDDKSGRDEKGRGTHGLRKKATTLFSVIAVIAMAGVLAMPRHAFAQG